ncbi:alpha/beta hydrolase [Vreelandella olivaria]|uniref:alpha/beta hydrolase n=1 Tax=Vreelandella olivaria TaxID=390919 RepID=UPI00201F847F|nr:alpha/beta hydrolase [Halomonas olivaria]
MLKTLLLKTCHILLCLCVALPAYAQSISEANLEFARELRAQFATSTEEVGVAEPVREIRDITVAAQDPAREIPTRLYLPAHAATTDLPVIVFVHGGGFVAGDLDSYDPLMTALANRVQAAVLSVDYRLAPETPFPGGLEDVYAVVAWASVNAPSFGGDGTRLAVSGDSAGGNIAAATSMLARDRDGPKIAAQLLMYPTLSNKMDTDSWNELGDTYFPTREINSRVIEAYVPEGTSHYDPLVAPLWGDHHDLPPTLIIVGSLDPLLDEARDYVAALNNVGGEAKVVVYEGAEHAFLQFFQNQETSPSGDSALSVGAEFLVEKLSAD